MSSSGQHLVVDVAGEPAAQFRDGLVPGGAVGVIYGRAEVSSDTAFSASAILRSTT
jgi:hypothetical protein